MTISRSPVERKALRSARGSPTKDPDLAEILNCVNKSDKKITDMLKDIKALKKDITAVLTENTLLKQKVTELESHLTNSTTEIKSLNRTVQSAFEEIEYLKEISINKNIILAGIPNRQQLPKTVAVAVFKAIKAEVNEAQITDCFYIGKEKGPHNLILVKLHSSLQKKEILLKKKLHKNLFPEQLNLYSKTDCGASSSSFPINQIFIREELTRAKRELFRNTRTANNQLKFKFLWIKNSNIYLREAENTEIIKIRSSADLASLHSCN